MGDVLEDWINPQHLTEAALTEAVARFRDDPCESLWLDDFLRPSRLEALRGLFRQDGDFVVNFGLYNNLSSKNLVWVDRAAYDRAPPELRFQF